MAAVPTIGRADGAAVRPASADEHAEVLYERLYERVYGYCLYRLGSREEAEDAAQVTFVHALRGLRRGVVPRVEAAWVFAIAKNVCLERHQVRGKRRAREVLLDPATLESTSGAEERSGAEAARLRDALTRLPATQREAVLLREWRGLSYREIAAEMGLSLSAVETLIFRARRSLAQHLTDETRRVRLARGLSLGPVAATLKGVLGGSAAKVAVAAALAAAAVAGGMLAAEPDGTDAPRPRAVEQAADRPPAVKPVFVRSIPAGPADKPARLKHTDKGAPEKATSSESAKESGGGGPVGETVKPVLGSVLEPVEPLLEPVVEPVQPVVKDVEATLAPVVGAVPELPKVELPALPALP